MSAGRFSSQVASAIAASAAIVAEEEQADEDEEAEARGHGGDEEEEGEGENEEADAPRDRKYVNEDADDDDDGRDAGADDGACPVVLFVISPQIALHVRIPVCEGLACFFRTPSYSPSIRDVFAFACVVQQAMAAPMIMTIMSETRFWCAMN